MPSVGKVDVEGSRLSVSSEVLICIKTGLCFLILFLGRYTVKSVKVARIVILNRIGALIVGSRIVQS